MVTLVKEVMDLRMLDRLGNFNADSYDASGFLGKELWRLLANL